MKLFLVVVILALFINTSVGQSSEKPNIVLLFVDDWGWMDVGYRNDKFITPSIDKLKNDGMDFTRAYVPTPTCSPSRATILTGKEAARLEMPRHISHENKLTGVNKNEYNYWPTDPSKRPSRNWLPLEEITYAEKLRELGYYNMFVGKWHLGHEPYHPIYQGFDEQFGTGNFGHPKSYYPDYFKDHVLSEQPDEAYLTDVLTDKTVDFITSYDKNQPFMLSLWYYNVHGPHIGRKDWVEKYKSLGLTKKEAEYAAMVSTMDESVGRVRDALEKKGIADNTVVFLISDQGGFFSQAPLSGGKRGGNTLGEGGSRIPFIVYYPEVTIPRSECNQPIQTTYFFPTVVEIASGVSSNNTDIDGISLMPAIKGSKLREQDLFFFRAYEDQSSALISGDWKLVKYLSGKYQLFNISKDIGEQNDLVDAEIKRAKKMKHRLTNWEEDALKPLANY